MTATPLAERAGGKPATPVPALIMLIWVVAALALYRASYSILPSAPSVPALTQIDPNTAPWWELSLLPHIGDTLARDIEQFRSAVAQSGRPAFQRAADLDDIRGIGPKTIQRLARHLRFPPTRDSQLTAVPP